MIQEVWKFESEKVSTHLLSLLEKLQKYYRTIYIDNYDLTSYSVCLISFYWNNFEFSLEEIIVLRYQIPFFDYRVIF